MKLLKYIDDESFCFLLIFRATAPEKFFEKNIPDSSFFITFIFMCKTISLLFIFRYTKYKESQKNRTKIKMIEEVFTL